MENIAKLGKTFLSPCLFRFSALIREVYFRADDPGSYSTPSYFLDEFDRQRYELFATPLIDNPAGCALVDRVTLLRLRRYAWLRY